MTQVRDPRVDAYLDALPDWQGELGQQVRDLVLGVDPQVEETIKRTVLPFYVLEGNICALFGAKDHLNVFLYDGAIVADPQGIITAGHENKTARRISYYEGDSVQTEPLGAIFAEIIANNRAGGWRKVKAARGEG